ncbi:hypothetical protein EVG20_g494 [Dentipellis fragilis]|uniref:4'-phosphopantetheinyl transferase domain-containing protein n=1 Tax=Dentipellis fragilis TaxID=205917 RepID=A0A4Y9ZDF7_9AGAM|nr:hypothetical protein EVG20_g494 [Dentipellis fragilis]
MGILGIGTDLVHIPRIAALLVRQPHRLPRRVLSPFEHPLWHALQSSEQRVRFVAVRWAVKEAAYKALYPTFIPTWKELSYLPPPSDTRGKPSLLFLPSSDRKASHGVKLHVSVTHDGEYAIASVVAERVP